MSFVFLSRLTRRNKILKLNCAGNQLQRSDRTPQMNLRELDATIQRHVAYNQQILLCVSMTTEVAVSLAEQGDDQEVEEMNNNIYLQILLTCYGALSLSVH